MLPRQGKGRVGFDWYASKSAPFEEHVRAAVGAAEQRFGKRPSTCYVNPKTLADMESTVEKVDGVLVCAAPNILENHFWAVVDEDEDEEDEDEPEPEPPVKAPAPKAPHLTARPVEPGHQARLF